MSELVTAAADGDAGAWRALVARFDGLVWSVARTHSVSGDDAADVVQTTWLNLAVHLRDVRDPARLGGWLATTARREALRTLAIRRRELPLADHEYTVDGPENVVVDAAVLDAMWRAVHGMPPPCRTLLRLIAMPDFSYARAARALGVRAGSVGPMRGRCLAALRRRLAAEDLTR